MELTSISDTLFIKFAFNLWNEVFYDKKVTYYLVVKKLSIPLHRQTIKETKNESDVYTYSTMRYYYSTIKG